MESVVSAIEEAFLDAMVAIVARNNLSIFPSCQLDSKVDI